MPVFGLLNINKPQGPTSHDIVARVRRGAKIKKVGHAGTLDPMATGVLILCLGAATRLSEYAMNSPKQYRARVRLGVETDTYDAEGTVIAQQDAQEVSLADVDAALAQFQGTIQQVPPMYSAIKQDGRKLYDLARAGQEVERPARTVTIRRLDVLEWESPFVTLDVYCTPGTYIRSLAHDLGAALGVGAHLAALTRTASGLFTVADAVAWDDLAAAMDAGNWQTYLLPPERAVTELPALHLDAAGVDAVCNGRWVAADDAADELARAYTPDGQFFAILERRGAKWKPHKVFNV